MYTVGETVMNARSARGKSAAGIVSVLALGAVALAVPSASAAASDGSVRGAGTVIDDWNDEGTLSTSSYNNSGATCLWQMVLQAEGYPLSDGADGYFGSETKVATRKLQARWGLADDYASADGKVGPKTFGRADGNLRVTNSSPTTEARALNYVGKAYSFVLKRASSGTYYVTGTGFFRYGSNTCAD